MTGVVPLPGRQRDLGILFTLSGLVFAAYAVLSAIAIWLAQRLQAADGAAFAARLQRDGTPAHHLDMLRSYSAGNRLLVWQASLVLLVLSVAAIVAGSPLAVYLAGLALGVDCLLFMTCKGREAILMRATPLERLVDAGQTIALLAAFLVLAWREIVNLG
jgi:hypothetical protein